MARSDVRFRAAHRALLAAFAQLPVGSPVGSEPALADQLGVSRTVVRAVLGQCAKTGLIGVSGRATQLLRAPTAADHLPARDADLTLDGLEARFLDWVLRFDVPAGTALNVTQLARQFNVPTHLLQEFLSSLGQSGLVERREKGGWRLLGFTADFAVELTEFRQLLELHAIRTLLTQSKDHPVWAALEDCRTAHLHLLARIDRDYHDFSPLDGRFHGVLHSVVNNRFAAQFQKTIALIFHYHYQWDKTLERHRNEAAIREHLRMMDALFARDAQAAEAATRAHLTTARETLLASLRDHKLG